MNTILLTLIIYCLAMVAFGYYCSRKELKQEDFLLGGKRLPGWALAFSERSTGESVWLLMGASGFVFTTGLSSVWLFVGSIAGVAVAWLFLAKKFMHETNKYKVLTIPDYLSAKFGSYGQLIRWVTSVTIISFFMFYLAAQFAGAGKTLFVTFDLDLMTGTLLTAFIVILYSSLGGFLGVVWTDVVQSLLMLATLIIIPIVALFEINASGLSISTELAKSGDGLDAWSGGLTGFGLGIMIFTNLSWFFGLLGGQPQLSSRFMALRNEKEAKTARNVALIWSVLAYSGVFMVGITALTLYGNADITDVETILPFMIKELTPPWLAGILLAGILAAMMSTADSQLLVITGSVSEDIMHKALGLKLTPKQQVTISRVTVVIAGVIGLSISLISDSLIFTIVNWAWAGIGCTFSAAICLAFFWKRCSGAGIVATVVTGFLVTTIWMSTPLEGIFTSRAASFFIAAFAGIVFSLLFPEKERSEGELKTANA